MGCCFGRNGRRINEVIDGESTSLVASLIVPDYERYQPRPAPRAFIREEPFDAKRSYIEWNRTADTEQVGELTVATVQFLRQNRSEYILKRTDNFRYSITHEDSSVTVNSIREPSTSLAGHASVRVSFTPRIIGTYTLTFKLNGQRIGGQEYIRLYIAGPPAAGRTVIHEQSNNMILRCGVYYTITISPRDTYGNVARLHPDLLYMTVKKGGSAGTTQYPDCVVNEHYDVSKINLLVKLDEPGYFMGSLHYEESVIGLQECTMICLTEEGMQKKDQNIQTNFLNIQYKARMIPQNTNEEPKQVKCYVSPRLFQIRGSILFITTRLFTCRVCNSTKIEFHEEPGMFTIDDGLQAPVTLISESREIIAAVFYSFIQRNSGGAQSFQEKQSHFRTELRQLNPGSEESYGRPTTVVNVRRYNLLESAMHATRSFKTDTWKTKFHVKFEGEDGVDVGGVSREFFTCICDAIFGGRNPKGLFTRLSDEDPHGLVHPTSEIKRESCFGLEYYEFAGRIVGKCLFETALGEPFLVKAHFTRSFLAQLIGLRISWKHFETDDPELYRYKIEQIRDTSIEDLGLSLTFADEVIVDGRPTSDPLIVSLHPGGSKQKVTDSNKMEYLTELAQERLASCVSKEVRAFLKGLREFIPDELLAMFDENELELLMCGVQKLSYQDLKDHTEVRGYSREFLQSVEWFWMAVREFTPEEMARLVQFVTGSSQIPVGGFAELRPPFLLASAGIGYNRLPYAHTCFNHLCLPNYDTYELFTRSLMTAINEGSEGILLT